MVAVGFAAGGDDFDLVAEALGEGGAGFFATHGGADVGGVVACGEQTCGDGAVHGAGAEKSNSCGHR